MIGLSGGTGNDNVTEILSLIDDDKRYTAKIKELDVRVQNAATTLAQATEQNKQAESHRALADKAFENAKAALAEANAVKAANETTHAALDSRSKEQDKRDAAHGATVADFNKHKLVAEADLADRSQNIANRDNESEKLLSAARAKRDEILEEAQVIFDKAKQAVVDADAHAADVAAKRQDFQRFRGPHEGLGVRINVRPLLGTMKLFGHLGCLDEEELASLGPTPANGYVTEDSSSFYVTEGETAYYVQET